MDLAKKVARIGIVFAMKGEAMATIQYYKLNKIKEIDSIEFYSNDDDSLIVSLNGKCAETGADNVGTQPATLNTYVHCTTFNPDIVINAGTAGGFQFAGAQIGDVYVGSRKVVYHDRRIPMPRYDDYGMGNYALLNTNAISRKLNLKQGIISTGNSLDFVDKDLQLMKASQAVLKDMEAASIAWVCKIVNKPFIAIKSVTDIVDNDIPTEIEFKKNFQLATANLNQKLVELIDYVKHKSIDEIFNSAE
jgi:5'-methylthioadenosine nucleosidase